MSTCHVQSVGGSNKYFINGEQQPTLELLEGNTYVFNYPSAHPFKFSTTSNGSHGGGSEYTTGVTHNSSTQVTIVVASGAPTLTIIVVHTLEWEDKQTHQCQLIILYSYHDQPRSG